jgi:hypothetical protein
MRRALLLVGTVVLLVGPTALAFFAGGYFDGPRVVAAGVAWALVLLLAFAGPVPLPASRAGAVTVVGLAGLAVWSAISLAWAPLIGPVVDSVQRLLLYLGALLVAVALLRDRRAARAVEPLLAAGALAAIGYGLAGRLVPGIVDLIPVKSFGAGGRLEQPITYWNAEGLLGAMGLVLSIRVAGDASRPAWLRTAAGAAAPPLGMGVYLSYSRGALAVAVLGVIVLLAAAPTWTQLRAAGAGMITGAAAAASSAAFPGVASLTGTLGERESDGTAMLVILALIVLGAGVLTAKATRAERRGSARAGPLGETERLRAVAVAATACCFLGLVAGGLSERGNGGVSPRAQASRFTSLSSVRYAYWRVGFRAFTDEPVRGLGAGGFQVFWRQHRRVDAATNQVHSLPLEIAAELGFVGLVLLALFVGGIAAAGRRALALDAPLAPGACAVCIVWFLHAAIDWDWQLPAVTLPAVVLAGGLLAAVERRPPLDEPASEVEVRDAPRREVALSTG